jgi:hypothetical protein
MRERVQHMSAEEANAWLVRLFKHIKKQHPHLDDREMTWNTWK